MLIQMKLSDTVYKSLKQNEAGDWIADINCTVKIGASVMRVNTIEERSKKREKTKRRRNWLENHGSDVETVKKLADRFARKFLNQKRYDLQTSDKEYYKFEECHDRITDFCKSTRMSYSEVVRQLFTMLEGEYINQGKRLRIGHLISDTTWRVLFPQYMKQIMPGFGTSARRSKRKNSKN